MEALPCLEHSRSVPLPYFGEDSGNQLSMTQYNIYLDFKTKYISLSL